jgi:hypothetical protein
MSDLVSYLESSPLRTVGFIGQGNFDSVSAVLPVDTQPLFFPNETEIVLNVHAGGIVAGYSSEGSPPEADTFNVFPTGIVSPRVALFHKDLLWSDCAGSAVCRLRRLRLPCRPRHRLLHHRRLPWHARTRTARSS